MKVSILIANYNNGKYFKDCYQSIINQTYKNWEVIIVDDCSTDNSLEIIRKTIGNDQRFKLYEEKENKGVGVVKPKLVTLSSGDIFCYVDPDDAILPFALEKHVDVLKKHPNVGLTYGNVYKCDENLKPINKFKATMQVPNGERYFFNFPIQIVSLVCIRKSIHQRIENVKPEYKIAEDQDLYLKMYEKGKVKFVGQTDYLYRAHSGGISQNENKEKSYNYWTRVIFEAMKRRNIQKINGKKVPEQYTNSQEIFDLLTYQNGIPFRIKKKLKIWFQTIFS